MTMRREMSTRHKLWGIKFLQNFSNSFVKLQEEKWFNSNETQPVLLLSRHLRIKVAMIAMSRIRQKRLNPQLV